MKRLLLALLVLISATSLVQAGERSNTVLLHQGEIAYARFEVKGQKLKLISYSTTKDDGAQLVFTLMRDEKRKFLAYQIQNHFPRDLTYKIELRARPIKKQFAYHPTPVVTGKVAFESFPLEADEVAVYGFQLEK